MSQKTDNIFKIDTKNPSVPHADDHTVWHINGCDLTLDMQDADTLERYEAAFEQMAVEEKAVPKAGKSSECVRAYCKMFRNLFNNIFGEGTDKLIFGEKDNSRIMTETYELFLDFAAEQTKVVTELQNRITNRYSPNRAARRAASRK